MKKLLWVLGTVIACVLWSVLVGFIVVGANIVTSIVTRSEIQSVDTYSLNPVIVLGWVALIIMSIMMWRRWKARCQACKRWGALKLIKTEILKQENISVLVELEDRGLNRQVIGTHDQYIPGKRNTYQDTYKCKHCGNLEIRIRTKDGASI